MTKVIRQPIPEGYHISTAALAALSPYQRRHVNRFGYYVLHREHRQDRFDQHALIPRPAPIELEIRWIPSGGVKVVTSQDDHLACNSLDERVKGGAWDLSSGAVPGHDPPDLIEQQTQFPADNPAVIGQALLADLGQAASLATPSHAFASTLRLPEEEAQAPNPI